MSNDDAGDGPETEAVRKSSLSGSVQASDGTRKNESSTSPSPIKKSKRQAERGVARAAFAATQRKEEEEDRFYRKPSPKKPKEKERSKNQSDNAASTTENPKSSQKKASKGASRVATPSPTIKPSRSPKSRDPTQSTTVPFPKSAKKRSKAPSAGEKISDYKNILVTTKTPGDVVHNRKRRKLEYKATSGPNRPIYGYALELISLVCNNSYCVSKAGGGSVGGRGVNKSDSTLTPPPTTKSHDKDRVTGHPQPHRVLDRPTGYTRESEPLRERLMRLQLRQRFASATSMGMSPIEFARKLLRLWGGTLEQVYETKSTTSTSAAAATANPNTDANTSTNTSTNSATNAIENTFVPERNGMKRAINTSMEKNNCSSLQRDELPGELKQAPRSQIEQELPALGDDWQARIESLQFDTSIGEFEPRSIHPDAQIGESKTNRNDLLNGDPFNLNLDPRSGSSDNCQHNTPTKLITSMFGESNERIERTKKLIQRRHRKSLKKADAMKAASSSSTIAPETQAPDSSSAPTVKIERSDTASSTNPSASLSPPKRKIIKRIKRKFVEDENQEILFKDMRLSHPDDEQHLNALHCFVRAKLLEVYVIQNKKEGSAAGDGQQKDGSNKNPADKESQNIVGIRCAWCGLLPRNQRGKGQSMSTFFPKSIGEIYRGVCTWQRIHFPVCEHMPKEFRTEYKIRKEADLTRGRKSHWIKSAFDLGLRNVDSNRNGLTYKPGTPFDLDRALEFESDPGGRSKNSRARTRRPAPSEPKTKPLVTRDDNVTTSISAFDGCEENEFELFGKDFDQSLEESTKAALTKEHKAVS